MEMNNGRSNSGEDFIIQPSVPLKPFFNLTLNGDFVAKGVGMRNINQAERGKIDLTGLVPAGSLIVKAFLYWSYMRSTATPNPNAILNGTTIKGTPVAIGIGIPCWPNVSGMDVYRADVTGIATDGVNTLTGFPSGIQDNSDPFRFIIPPLLEGASLVLIYSNPNSPRKTVLINDGGTSFNSDTVTTVFSGFKASSSPKAKTVFIVGDGQANAPSDQAIFNGTLVAGPTTPIKPADAFNGQDGIGVTGNPAFGGWDTLEIDVSPLVKSGDTTASAAVVASSTGGDCLTYIAQVFSVTAQALQPSKTFINNSGATLQVTLFVRQGSETFNQDGTVSFTLNPFQRLTVPYGSDQNPFLNGILLFTIFQNDLYSKIQFVTARGSELDNVLNTNQFISISKIITDFLISGSN